MSILYILFAPLALYIVNQRITFLSTAIQEKKGTGAVKSESLFLAITLLFVALMVIVIHSVGPLG